MDAPVLILPENVSEPTGAVLVVDLGKLSFRNDDKVIAIDTPLDTALDTTDNDPRLHWRLEVTQIHVSLGRQEQLVNWSDEEVHAFSKIVKELSLEFLLHTQASSTRLRLPSRGKNTAVKPLPQVGVYAAVPSIVVSAEEQLVALGQIHSSILVQAAAIARAKDMQLTYFEDQEDDSGEESTTDSESASDQSSRNVATATATIEDKFLLEMELSLGCVELNLRESSAQDAFVLRASHTSFAVEAYSTRQVFHARLKALVMEDKLYSPDSRFYKLISTGESGGDTTHLIAIGVTTFSPESTQNSSLQVEADVQFNVLHLQWNPSSVALFYRIISAYASAIQSHDDDFPSEALTSPVKSTSAPTVLPDQTQPGKKNRVAVLSTLRSRGRPVVVVRASLVQFSLTFNKDQIDRQLARLEMTNSALNYTSYAIERSAEEDAFEVTGHVGNFVGTDLSTSKHPLYATLLGLDEDEARRRSTAGEKLDALLSFEFASDPVVSGKSALRLAFQPIRGVYYHQQVLELVDFVLEGVLGAMVSQTLMNATQLLLREDEASVVLDLSVEKPTLILPLSLEDAPHAKVTANVLRLVHFPSSAVHYHGPPEARIKQVVHDEALPRAVVHTSDGVSLRVDCKDLFLEQVHIYCTTAGGKKTKEGEGPVYEELLPEPADLKISIEDLVSSTISIDENSDVFLPRITVDSVLPPLEAHLSRTSYLGIVALILENFGAEELQNEPDSAGEMSRTNSSGHVLGKRRSSADTDLPSLRPTVRYTYLQADADEATLQVRFVMENVRVLLYQDKQLEADEDTLDSMVQRTFESDTRRRDGALAEVVATDFSLVFDDEYEKNPRLAVHLGAFSARDLVGEYKSSSDESGTLLVSPQPLEIRYTWDDTALTGDLDLLFSEVTGTVIPEALLSLLGFFALPTKPGKPGPTKEKSLAEASRKVPPSPSLLTRRESISDILRDGKEPDLTITIRATAKQVGVALPRDAYDPDSPRVTFAGDFTLEFMWKPHPDPKKGKNGDDLDIQSSILADARNMEVVLENARRPGCCVAAPATNAKWDAIDVAPLIQLLEPCSLHVEVSDLFPHAGQRQQIVALSFTPIEVFVSYDDARMAMDTMEALNTAIEQHEEFKRSSREPLEFHSLTRARTSSKSLVIEEEEVHRYFTCERRP
ncbi:hypothetical protein P3T76_016362 [Phytophthora citrophthora]|uniref:Uncharacterized protein n=1 Tax=Phytophthora citrophthora TaxID=4793 RepID=A0AAD9FXT3_9STRA|nr:hypothetical protein P3T76_016362 [Phytophthora citrophthora]